MSQSTRAEVLAALRALAPILMAVVPFGMVYGAIAIGSGISLAETMGLTATVYAGASQLAALQLLGLGAPLWSVLLTVAALNFRHVLYSAAIGRHLTRFSGVEKAVAFFFLVDPMFGAAESRAVRHPLTKTFYFTYALALYCGWVLSSLVGALFGALIEDPKTYGLDFILPVYFLALLMTFRGRDQFYPVAFAAAIVSMGVYLTIGAPWHVTAGGLAGIAVAALRTPPQTGLSGEGADV